MRGRFVSLEQLTDAPHWGQARKPVAKALHSASFVVHADEQLWRALGMNIRAEPAKLSVIEEIIAEQDDSADQRMTQARPISRIELMSAHGDEHRP
jgi:hypothetical protein